MPQKKTNRLTAIAGLALLGVLAAVLATVGSGTAGAAGGATTTTAADPPKNTDPPTLTGTPTEGETLTATNGSWTGSNVKFVYRFLRCDKNGGGCFTGGSTTQKTYRLTEQDVGRTVRVRVTASNTGGTSSSTSAPTAVIKKAAAKPPAASNGCPSGTGPIDITQLSLPARLLIDGQAASPSTITPSTTTLTLRFHVSACNGRPVGGALVYAAAVPFNQFSITEGPTGADGWATLTEHQQSGFPASSKQQLLAVFVRARKPGENLVGGVATRLLVSFPVRR